MLALLDTRMHLLPARLVLSTWTNIRFYYRPQEKNPGRYQARVDTAQPESPGIVVISMGIRKRDLEGDFLSLCIGRFLGLARGKCRRRRHFALFLGLGTM